MSINTGYALVMILDRLAKNFSTTLVFSDYSKAFDKYKFIQ